MSEAKLSSNDLLSLLPRHACSLQITHNQHLDYYETVQQRLDDLNARECPPCWESDDEKQKAIDAGELWELHWYPDTPVGFYQICAASLGSLLSYASKLEGDNPTDQGR